MRWPDLNVAIFCFTLQAREQLRLTLIFIPRPNVIVHALCLTL